MPLPASLLDLQMPDLTGLEVQELLANRKNSLPIVFISGHGNIPSSVQAMKAGAIDFLTKPFDEEQLIIAIDAAIERARESQQRDNSFAKDRDAFERLSQRERQVCVCVAEGMLNKQIAAKFGTKEKTIKVQRGNLIKKLGAHSAADIVRLVERLRLPDISPSKLVNASRLLILCEGERKTSDCRPSKLPPVKIFIDDFLLVDLAWGFQHSAQVPD